MMSEKRDMLRSMQVAKTVALCLLLSTLSISQINAEENRAAEAKNLFITVETVSRLKQEDQRPHVQRMYEEIFPSLRSLRVWGLALPGPSIHQRGLNLSPEELADSILDQKNDGWLVSLATDTCVEILRSNQEHLDQFIKADIQSDNRSNRERSLYVIGELRMTNFFESVLHIFETDSDLAGRASYTLRDIRDPRAIAPIVKMHPDLATDMVFEVLRNLQTANAADPSLLVLLKSKDPEVRWRAAYALAESGDPELVPHVIQLVKDEDARVRKQASNIGFCMKGKAFEAVRHALIFLLSDSNTAVRSFATISFAQRKDAICARTLLDLLRDTSIEERQHSNIVQAVHRLTGSYFDYHIGSDAWEPTTENNRRAIKQFADWIDKIEASAAPE